MLRLAAAPTVDETKTAFAKWKAFSLSAVPSSSDYSEVPAITLAPGIDELLQPTDSSRTSRHVRFVPTSTRQRSREAYGWPFQPDQF